MDDQYTGRLQKIEGVLNEWLPEKPDSSWIDRVFAAQGAGVSPDASPASPCRDLLDRGGKRWRPLLMLLSAETIAGVKGGEAALPFVPLVEFSHNASLIHDDIEDNSDTRRGKPAVHILYGTDTAINAGSFLYFLSSACLLRAESSAGFNHAARNKIWEAWALHIRALHLGQAMDIEWHRNHLSLPSLGDYDRMCRLKTGCLARLAAVLGVYCAGEGEDVEKTAQIFGGAAERLGVGFQILDDVKNLSAGVPGKKRGDDIVEGKKSLPVLLYLHRYPEKRDFAARCFAAAQADGINVPELEIFIGALEKAGVLEEAREKALVSINESRKIFSAPEAGGIALKKEGRELLAGLIDYIS